jgi:hypothetical protein
MLPCLLVDTLGNTAADVALSLNNEDCYLIIRDAGIRSGLSTSRHARLSISLGPEDRATAHTSRLQERDV